MNPVSLGELVVSILGDTTSIETAFLRTQSMAQTAAKRLGKIASEIESTGQTLMRGLTLPLLGLGIASVKSFTEFDDAITRSSALWGGVSDSMRANMEATARTISESTSTSATDLAKSYGVLARSGLTAGQSVAALATIEQFATASQLGMAEAAKLLSDTQRVLGLRSDDAAQNTKNMTRLQDELFKTSILSGVSIEDLSEALRHQGAAAMREFNVPLEKGLSLLAMFATQGFKGGRSGAKVAEYLKEHGGAVPVATALEAAIGSAGGSSAKVAAEVTGDFSSNMAILWHNVEGVAREIGAELVPYVKQATTYVQQGLTWWRGLSEENKHFAVNLGLAAAALGPLLVGIGSIGSVIGSVPFALFVTGAGLATDALLQLTGKGNLGLLDLAEQTRICGFKMSTWMTASFLEIEKEWVELTQKVGNWKYLLGPLGLLMGDADKSAEGYKAHVAELDNEIRKLFEDDQKGANASAKAKSNAAASSKEDADKDAAAKKEAAQQRDLETGKLKEQAKLRHEIAQSFMQLDRKQISVAGLAVSAGSAATPAATAAAYGVAAPWTGTKDLGTGGRSSAVRAAALENGIALQGPRRSVAESFAMRPQRVGEDMYGEADDLVPSVKNPLVAANAGKLNLFSQSDTGRSMLNKLDILIDVVRSRTQVATFGSER